MSGSPLSPIFEVGVVTFEGEDAASRLVDSLRGSLGFLNDVAILEHKPSGSFSVHDYSNEATKGQHVGAGALIGGVTGALLLGPFGVLIGVLGGAGVGASMQGANPHELALSDDFIDKLKASLPPGSSAVLVMGEPDRVDTVMGEIRSAEAVTRAEFKEPLNDAQVAAIRTALEKGQADSAG